jgi:formylglycine-generating enzyme required for sulfatase activity
MRRAVLTLCFALPAIPVLAARPAPSVAPRARGEAGGAMASLPGAPYRAVTAKTSAPTQEVPPFRMDRTPVTNESFLTFVVAHPAWQRDRVSRLVADERYLGQWAGPVALGPEAPPRAPVVGVSWFAAGAYCASRGARLPSEAEWEIAAAASPKDRDGRRDPVWRQTVLDWYARPNPPRLPDVGQDQANYWGIHDLHGLVWEWVSDFGASMLVGKKATLCGGGALDAVDPLDYPAFLRAAFRSSLEGRTTTTNLGFRCVQDANGDAS